MNILQALQNIEHKKVKCNALNCTISKHKNGTIQREFSNGSKMKLYTFTLEEVKSDKWKVVE
jgi:hypothetical protein